MTVERGAGGLIIDVQANEVLEEVLGWSRGSRAKGKHFLFQIGV